MGFTKISNVIPMPSEWQENNPVSRRVQRRQVLFVGALLNIREYILLPPLGIGIQLLTFVNPIIRAQETHLARGLTMVERSK